MKILGYLILIPVIIALVLALLAGSVLWTGFVLSTLWAWFLIPLGAPAVGVIHAAGIGMIVRFMTFQFNVKDYMDDDLSSDEKLKKSFIQISYGILYPLMALVFGWAVKQYM
jgi:hypothetical protein